MRHAAPLATLAAIAVLVTWPTAALQGRAIPGHPTSDAYDHLWGTWWFGHELAHGSLPLRTTISHWPPGGLLWFIDPGGAILSLPFQAILGVAGAFDLVVILQVFGAMAAAYALAIDAGRAPAMVAGIVYGASPYAISLLHSGTLEYLSLAPLPLAWWAFGRTLAGGERRDVALAAGAWAWATLGNFYYAAFAGILLVVAMACAPAVEWRTRTRRATGIVVAYAAFAAPIFAVAAWTLGSPDAVIESSSAPGWRYQTLPATDLLTFVHPGDYFFPDNRKSGNHGIIHVNYVGWIVIALAIWGAWKDRRWRLPLAVATVLALGPILCVNQDVVFVAGRPVPLPAALLYLPGSPFRFVHHPFRLVVLVMLFAGQAAAFALASRPRWAPFAGAAVLAETLLFSPISFPVPTAPATAPAAVTELAGDASVDALWDFPPDHHVLNRRYQMFQTIHHKRVPYGVNSFLPEAWRDNHFVRAMLRCRAYPVRATIAREGGRPLEEWLQRPVTSKIPAGRAALVADGYDLVVLHLGALAETERTCARERLAGTARHADSEVELWGL